MSGASLTVKDKSDQIKKLLDSRMDSIARALPKHFMSAPRLAQIILSVCGRNPKLMDANHASLIGAVLQCAALGLDPEPALGQAWFVPYKGIVQFQVGYKGYANLAWQSGLISSLSMQVVREGDEFDYEYGTSPYVKHKPRAGDNAPMTHAYATAKPTGGEMLFEVLTKEQVDSVRRRSPAGNNGPWVSDYEAMARKTAFKRAAKLLPMASEKSRPLARALDFDMRAELGMHQHLDEVIIDATGEQPQEESQEAPEEPGSNG